MDFTGMSPEQALLAASQDLSLPDNFFDNMWKQESGRGQAMRSPKGARGHFQVMPATQRGGEEAKLFKPGLDPDNFYDGLTMAHALMKQNLARWKTPEAATAAYNGGWAKTEELARVKWDNPETRGYVAAILGNEALARVAPTVATVKNQKAAAAVQPGTALEPDALAVLPQTRSAKEQTAEAEAAAVRRENASFTDLVADKWRDNRSNGLYSVIDFLNKPDGDPSFDYWAHREEIEKDTRTWDEAQFLRENVRSPQQAEWAWAELKRRRELDARYQDAPGWQQVVAELAVGVADPTGWIAGFGAYKGMQIAGIGARAAIAAGRPGLAVLSATAEAAAGNVAWEGLQDALGQQKTLADYAMAAGFGAGMGLAFSRGVHRQASNQALKQSVDDLVAGATARVEADIASGTSAAARAASDTAELRAAARAAGTVGVGDDVDKVMPKALADEVRLADGDAPAVTPTKPTPMEAKLQRDPAPDAGPEAPDPGFHDGVAELTGRDADELTRAELRSAIDELTAGGEPARGTPEAAELAGIREELAAIDAKLGESDNWRTTQLASDSYVQFGMKAPIDGKAPVGESLREQLAAILDKLPEAEALIAKRILAANHAGLDAVHVRFVQPDHAGLDKSAARAGITGGRWAGVYRKHTGDLYVNKMTSGQAITLLHEGVHALTAHAIRAYKQAPHLLTPAQKTAVLRLTDLHARFTQRVDFLRSAGRKVDGTYMVYATKNVDEFVAVTLGNNDVRLELANMPGMGWVPNALREFVQSVVDLLGIASKKTALHDTLAQVEVLIGSGGVLPDGINFAPSDLFAVSPQQHMAGTSEFARRMEQHALDFEARNPIDQNALNVLAAKAAKGGVIRDYALTDGLKMASSANPIVRMLSGLIVETTTGAAGRRVTAAVKKEQLWHKILGNTLPDYEAAYADFRRRSGGGVMEDLVSGAIKRKFNKQVAVEILNRRYGNTLTTDGAVKAAADSLQGLYQRSLDTQKAASTLGSGYLPPDAVGYMPQALRGEAIAAASPAELGELAEHLSKHWQAVYGWSPEFSDTFSRFYLKRAAWRSNGHKGVDFVALESPSAAVRDTLEQMRLESRDLDARARAELDRVGAQPQNKKRLDVDLLATLPSGKQVLDYYSTDMLTSARQHANRVAGSSALADFNVLGQRGVNNIMAAVFDAPPEWRATKDEVAAVERSFAELLGVPWHGERRIQSLNTLTSLVRVQRMGGMAFTQAAEVLNVVSHLGLNTALSVIGSLPRQLGDISRIRKGVAVDNPWLSSVEKAMGFEFGLEPYRVHAWTDPPDELLRESAKGSSLAERVLQGANFVQAKVSFFRATMAAQHRAVAEHIIKRAVGYIKEGGSANASRLRDMGFTDDLVAELRKDIDVAAGPNYFDIAAFRSEKAQAAFLAAVHRGTKQIIQDTFVGERGAWAHDDFAKALFQFRTFSLTAVEKQWGRAKNVDGAAAAAGHLLVQWALVLPIYLARQQAYAAGREDRDEYLKKVTSPQALVAGMLNYTALGGFMGDVTEALMGVAGGVSDDAAEALGQRRGGGSRTLADTVPLVSSINAAGRIATGDSNWHQALKQLPLSNLPQVAAIINLTK